MHGNTNYFKYLCFASHLAYRKGLWKTRQIQLSCSNSTAFFMVSQDIIHRSLVLGSIPGSAASRTTTSTWSTGRISQGPALSTGQHFDKNVADGKASTAGCCCSQPAWPLCQHSLLAQIRFQVGQLICSSSAEFLFWYLPSVSSDNFCTVSRGSREKKASQFDQHSYLV